MKKSYLLLILLLLIFGCTPREEAVVKESIQTDETSQNIPSVEKRFANVEITYLEGWITLVHNGEEREGQIGDLLQQGDQIWVEEGSSCEIQLGDLSLIQVEENTRITLSRSLETEGGTKGEISLNEGSVFCKVQKIFNEDSFQVRTDSAVCGVRGTQFMVRKEKDKEELQVAVLEGAVAMSPPDLEWDVLKDQVKEGNQSLEEEMIKIEESFPLIKPGEEMVIRKSDMQQLNEELQVVKSIIEESASTGESEDPVDEEKLEQIKEIRQRVSIAPPVLVSRPMAVETKTRAETMQAGFTQTLPEKNSEEIEIPTEENMESDKSNPEQNLEKNGEAETTLFSQPENREPEKTILALGGSTLIGAPVIAGNRIFVTDRNGVVTSLAGGRKEWQVQTGNSGLELTRPTAGGTKVILAGKQNVSLFSQNSGGSLSVLDPEEFPPLIFGQTPLIEGNFLYYPVLDGVVKYDMNLGKTLSKATIGSAANMTPAWYQGQILMADISGKLFFIDGETMEILEELETPAAQPVALSISVQGNRGVFSGRKGNAVSVDLQKHSLLWDITLPESPVYHRVETGASGCYFFTQNSILAYNWQGEALFVLNDAASAPLYSEEGLIWGDTRGNLILCDPETGKEWNRFPLGTPLTGKPEFSSQNGWILLADKNVVLLKNFP